MANSSVKQINRWDVWYTDFPFDDNGSLFKKRPVIILNVEPLIVSAVKITSHSPRDYDKFDVQITKWKEAGLTKPSTARVSKTIDISKKYLRNYVGTLNKKDRINIINSYMSFCNTLK